MSFEYDRYLKNHKENVAKGFHWMQENIPVLVRIAKTEAVCEWNICYAHDESKTKADEYDAYDAYFYGNNKSHKVVQDFNMAWLKHIHRNPHHWQHWILVNDDPGEGTIVMDMPYKYIVEMICDWWAFSWAKGNLNEIFSWYDEHKAHMQLSEKTRETVELILEDMKKKLEEGSGNDG